MTKMIKFKCQNCGAEFEADPMAQGYRACSPECIKILREKDFVIAEQNWLDPTEVSDD